MDEPPWMMVEVFRAPTRKECMERALVLQAQGMPFRVNHVDGLYRVFVPTAQGEVALEELDHYSEENVDWPPPKSKPEMISRGTRSATVYALLVAAIYPIGRSGLFGKDWWTPGKMHAEAVLDGEWWRVVTSLTLHGDLGHLVGNASFGALFGLLAAHSLGFGLAWSCILLSGAFGNLLNAILQDPRHTAIGASTAVFGALGLLMTYEWVRRKALNHSPMRRFAPILAGAVLLGWFGMGGTESNTDVVAHVTGLVAGAVLGFGCGKLALPERIDSSGQAALAAAALGLVVVAWASALA